MSRTHFIIRPGAEWRGSFAKKRGFGLMRGVFRAARTAAGEVISKDCAVATTSNFADFFGPHAMAAFSPFFGFVHRRIRLTNQGINRNALFAVQPYSDA